MDVGRARAFSTHRWFAGWPAVSPDVDAALRWLLDKMTMQWVVGSGKRSKAAADDIVDAT